MPHPLAPHLPPATRFLLEEVCLSPAEPMRVAPPFSAAELAAQARQQRIAGLLYQWAERGPATPWTSATKSLLLPAVQANAVKALALVQEALAIAALFEREQIPVIFLKGPFLSRRYYGDFGIRHAGDLDLLVDEADVRRADAVLRGSGYARTKPVNELSGRRWQLYLDTQHEFGYRPAAKEMLVELHWRFADCRRLQPASFAEMWSRGETLDGGGKALKVLGPADTFMQLAIHGALVGWPLLKWVADLGRMPVQPSPVASPVLDRILQLARSLAGTQAPGRDAPWLPDAHVRIARNYGAEAGASAGPVAKVRDVVAGYRYLFGLVDGWGDRLSLLRANLIMPADFDQSAIADGLTPLLPYVAQFRRGVRKLGSS